MGETTARKLASHTPLVSAASSNQAYKAACKFMLRWEGGYSNLKADRGGETNKGVTWQTYNAYRRSKGLPLQSVRFLSEVELGDIYFSRYWIPANCDSLPPLLAMAHFDWAVNAGVGRSQATLRQACGGLNLQRAIAKYGDAGLTRRYNDVRERYYRSWGRGSQSIFLNGWLNRLQALRSLVAAA